MPRVCARARSRVFLPPLRRPPLATPALYTRTPSRRGVYVPPERGILAEHVVLSKREKDRERERERRVCICGVESACALGLGYRGAWGFRMRSDEDAMCGCVCAKAMGHNIFCAWSFFFFLAFVARWSSPV